MEVLAVQTLLELMRLAKFVAHLQGALEALLQ